MHTITNAAAKDHAAYCAAVASAQRRALHSYYDQHIIKDEAGTYLAIDEGDYGALTMALIDRIVHTVAGGLLDEH